VCHGFCVISDLSFVGLGFRSVACVWPPHFARVAQISFGVSCDGVLHPSMFAFEHECCLSVWDVCVLFGVCARASSST
jgi:hypothetical protein